MSMLDPGWIPARLKSFSTNRTVLSMQRLSCKEAGKREADRAQVAQFQSLLESAGSRWRNFRLPGADHAVGRVGVFESPADQAYTQFI